MLCCGCGVSYECSRCGKNISEAYYDPFRENTYYCEECAKDYFSPMPYASYKVSGNTNSNSMVNNEEDIEIKIQVDDAIMKAKKYWDSKQYDEAIQLLEENLECANNTQQNEIKNLIAQIDEEYRNETIFAIKHYMSSKDYETALEVSSKALSQQWFDDLEILALQNEIKKYIPEYLGYQMRVSQGIEKITSVPYYDVNGNLYENAEIFWTTSVYSKETEILYDVYSLEGKYKHLSAVVAPASRMEDICDETDDTIFYIVGDGIELFSTYINKDTNPVFIEIDVTGVSELKVGIRGGNLVQILFADRYLYKLTEIEETQQNIQEETEEKKKEYITDKTINKDGQNYGEIDIWKYINRSNRYHYEVRSNIINEYKIECSFDSIEEIIEYIVVEDRSLGFANSSRDYCLEIWRADYEEGDYQYTTQLKNNNENFVTGYNRVLGGDSVLIQTDTYVKVFFEIENDLYKGYEGLICDTEHKVLLQLMYVERRGGYYDANRVKEIMESIDILK